MVPVSLIIDIEVVTGTLPAAGAALHRVAGLPGATGHTRWRLRKQTAMVMNTVHTRAVSAPPEQVARTIAGVSH